MSDLADQARANAGQPGPRCQVEIFLGGLDEESAQEVVHLLATPDLTNPGIVQALRLVMGGSPSEWSVGNHRRGNCRCKP